MWRIILFLVIFGQGFCANIFDFSGFDDPLSIFSNTRATLLRQHHGSCRQTTSSTGDEGTCMPRPECTVTGGTGLASTDCLLGICCAYSRGCGQTSNKRISYFERNGGKLPNNCTFTVNVENANVCQMRIDFEQFSLPAPTAPTSTATPAPAYRCQDAYFEIVKPLVASAPLLCGNNDGQHMYVPINDAQSVVMQVVNVDGTNTPGSWNIKVTQLQCPGSKHQKNNNQKDDFNLLAPNGCLQYFTESTGIIRNFNFDQSKSLITENHYTGNMNYASCIRRDPDACGISYTARQFQLSGDSTATPANCPDYLYVTNGQYTDDQNAVIQSSTYCGMIPIINQTIISNTPGPFSINFRTNNVLDDNAANENGYVLRYNTRRGNAMCTN